MSASDWYARKLGQQQQQRPEATPPTQQFTPMPAQQQRPLHIPASGAPQQQQELIYEEDDIPEGHSRIGNAITRWRGGRGNADAQTCPECGSSNYYSRRNREGGGWWGSDRHPAPHCYDCGYPIVQTGSIGGELGGRV